MSRPTYNVVCPKCGVAAGEHCRSLKTHRVTDTHAARMDEEICHRYRQRLARQGAPVACTDNQPQEQQ